MSVTAATTSQGGVLEAGSYEFHHTTYIKGLEEKNKDASELRILPQLSDPLQVLPQELWEQIILESTPDPALFPIRSHFDQIITLTAVSNRWQSAILSTPRLWNVIELADEIEDLEEKVFVSVNLSQGLPLYLECQLPVWSFDVTRLLRASSHRIRSIKLMPSKFKPFYTEAYNVHVRLFLHDLHDLSSLEELYAQVYDELAPNLDDILSRTTKLRMLDGASTSKETLQLEPLLNLRQLRFTLKLEEIVAILPKFKRLEHLFFLKQYNPYEQIDIPRIPGLHEIGPISVTTVACDLRRPGRIERFLPHVRSTLTILRTSANWSTLTKLMHACGNMPHLHTFDFNLLLSTGTKFQPPPQDSVALSLRVLIMEIGTFGGVYPEEQDLEDKYGNVDLLFSTLVNWAPGVREVDIGSSSSKGSPWPYVTQLKDLEVLKLDFRFPLPTHPDAILLPTVEKVWIWNRINITIALQCPKALNCSIYLPDGGSDIYKIAVDGWQNLRILTIPRVGVEWSGISLPNLEHIRLDPEYTSGLDETTCELFYEEIARNPSSFPMLQTIEDQEIPEWDTLFILLERRNITPPQGVKLISSLIIPLLPPPFILRPLTDRLRGQMSPRPSNISLSRNGMAAIYFDHNIPGCAICHQLFWNCNEQWGTIVSFSRKPQEIGGTILFDPNLPPYPDSVEEILETRQNRAQAWSEAITKCSGTHGYRSPTCARNSYLDMLEITGYTLHGSTYESIELYHYKEFATLDDPRE